MIAINPRTLKLFFASSTATVAVFSQFEPVLARVDRKSFFWNEEKGDDLEQGHFLSSTSRNDKLYYKEELSPVLGGAYLSATGRLTNKTPPTLQQEVTRERSCDPDVGILGCKVGEYCKRYQTSSRNSGQDLGGICVPTKKMSDESENHSFLSGHLEEQNARLLFHFGCDVVAALYIESDIDSKYENYWTITDESGNFIVPPTSIKYSIPYICLPQGDAILKLSIYDTYGDGIDCFKYCYGLILSTRATPFFIDRNPSFFSDGFSYVVCFKCPTDCCYEVGCDNGMPVGFATATCSPSTSPSTSSPTVSPTTSLTASPNNVPSASPRAKKSAKKNNDVAPKSKSGQKANKKGGTNNAMVAPEKNQKGGTNNAMVAPETQGKKKKNKKGGAKTTAATRTSGVAPEEVDGKSAKKVALFTT